MRIIAGRFKGRTIRTGRTRSVRPTSDRVREALFSILGDAVRGARVLDLYAGSGALGFEALSRGAVFVRFVERDPSIARWITSNRDALGIDDVEIVRREVAPWLERARDLDTFSLAFLDPPYRADELAAAVGSLSRAGFRGLAVVERDRRDEIAGAEAIPRWTEPRTYGDTVLEFLSIGSAPDPGPEEDPR